MVVYQDTLTYVTCRFLRWILCNLGRSSLSSWSRLARPYSHVLYTKSHPHACCFSVSSCFCQYKQGHMRPGAPTTSRMDGVMCVPRGKSHSPVPMRHVPENLRCQLWTLLVQTKLEEEIEQVRDDLRLALGALGVKPPTPEPEGKNDSDEQEQKSNAVSSGEIVKESWTSGQAPLATWARQVGKSIIGHI